MLDVQKNMRHDIMNDIQVIYGYLQLNNPEKAMDYSKLAVKRMQRYQELGRIPLPLLQSFLTWFVSQFNNDTEQNFAFFLTGDWTVWQAEDEELTQLLMELFCSAKDGFLNNSIKCKFSFTIEAPVFSMLFEGNAEQLKGLYSFSYPTEKLSWERQEIVPAGLLFTIKKNGYANR